MEGITPKRLPKLDSLFGVGCGIHEFADEKPYMDDKPFDSRAYE
jgi:hypothetical protein